MRFLKNYILETKASNKLYKNLQVLFYKIKRGQVVARIYWIIPLLGELYELRILLQRLPCFSCFERVTHPTFQKAARSMGLFSDASEYLDTFKDAAIFMTRPNLRKSFTY